MKADPAPVRSWLAEPMPPDVKRATERLRRLPGAARIAIMPDVHLASGVCVGTVLATRGTIYPAAIGADIGCGVATVALHGELPETRRELEDILNTVRRAVPIMRHRSLDVAPAASPGCEPDALLGPGLAAIARREGRTELGTLGRGNHFLELQRDAQGSVWLMVHSGSRAMGQAISDVHAKAGTRVSGGLAMLDADSDEGAAYLHDVDWAVRYAAANRRSMLAAAGASLEAGWRLRAEWQTCVDTSHNHVRLEDHEGEALLVHRKGAAPAAADENGLIPGCMGGGSYHVTGRGEPQALCSSSHGAGRSMSRSEARRRISTSTMLDQIGETVVDRRSLRSLLDEAPGAYKDVEKVMRAQRDLVRIVRRVEGVVCYKGV